jgi:hypothetical protein
MKKLLFAFAVMFFSAVSFGQGYTYVNGYTRSNGTYVQGHYRTLPNDTRNDNWSTVGNVNPFTGVAGTKPGDSYYPSSYGNIYTPSISTQSISYPSLPSTTTYSTHSTYDVIMSSRSIYNERTSVYPSQVKTTRTITYRSIY